VLSRVVMTLFQLVKLSYPFFFYLFVSSASGFKTTRISWLGVLRVASQVVKPLVLPPFLCALAALQDFAVRSATTPVCPLIISS